MNDDDLLPPPDTVGTIAREQADYPRVVAMLAKALRDLRESFLPVGRLWPGRFDDYHAVQRFLAKYPEIRTYKPTRQRLYVHAGDWSRHPALPAPLNVEDDPDPETIEATKAELDRERLERFDRRHNRH